MDARPTRNGVNTLRSACPECTTDNPERARFCKHCGAALAPPPACPKCAAALPDDARFCPSCGAKLVGPRPVELAPPESNAHARASATEAAKEEIARRAEQLPAAPRIPSSNLGGNVLLFVAILALLLVVIYVMNKDAPKEFNPFEGGPPPAAVDPSPSAPATASLTAEGGAPISGTIRLPARWAERASGTIFVVVRMAGTPDRGPPLAVKRIRNPSFPQAFTVGPADIMLPNMPFRGPFDVYVRLDRDGNAMSKEPGDLASSTPAIGIDPGTTGLIVELDKQL